METEEVRRCIGDDFEAIWAIVNDGAQAYRGVIPPDCLHEPYMSREALQREIASGVKFWGCIQGEELVGVMGLQDVDDVTLIRHAYVRTTAQKRGVGTTLLAQLRTLAKTPVLIGTWADAAWAIRFYERHGFRLVTPVEKDLLLPRYWTISQRQIDTSVVLADAPWFERSLTQREEAL